MFIWQKTCERRLQLWISTLALADMFTIPNSEIPTEESLPERLLKIFPMIGFAPFAVCQKTLLQKNNIKKVMRLQTS